MIIKKRLMKRQITGETFLVPLGTTGYDSNGLFYLTEVGAFLWDRLPEAENEEQLLAAILETYDVDEETARKDLSEFMEKLRAMEIL